MKRPIVSTVVGLALAGCGSSPTVSDGGPDAGLPDGDVADGPVDGPVFNQDASMPDATDAATIVLDGGGSFVCQGCVCDGVDHFCANYSGGASLLTLDGGFGDAGVCDPDAGQTACTAIPPNCLPNPSCDCVLANVGTMCSCDLDPSGAGLIIGCVFP